MDKQAGKTPFYRQGWGWLLGLTAGGLLIFILFAVIFSASWPGNYYDNGFHGHGWMMADRNVHMSENNGQTRYSGVVTSVSPDGFILAGDGASTTVKIDSTTSYSYGNEVKSNDTVIVYGTKANGTISADRVVINP